MSLSYTSTRVTSVYASGVTQDNLGSLNQSAFEALASTINGRVGANGTLSYSLASAMFAITGQPQNQVVVKVGLPVVNTASFDSFYSVLQPFAGNAGPSTWSITFQECLFTTEYQNAIQHDTATTLSNGAFEAVASTINGRTGSDGSVQFTAAQAMFVVTDANGQPQATVFFGCQLNPVNNTTMDALVTSLGTISSLNVTPPNMAPVAPSNLTAVPVSSTEIDLSWSYGGGDATGFTLLHSTDGGSTYSTLATVGPSPQSYPNTGLTASTAYFYKVEVTTANGTSVPSAPANATTQAASGPPAAPSNLVATPTGPTTMTLTWTDNSFNETGFSLERSPHGAGTYSVVGTPAANASTFLDSRLTASTIYDYRMLAAGTGGNSAYSNVATGTTPSASAPAVPVSIYLLAVGPNEVDLAFADTNAGTATYLVENSTDNVNFSTVANLTTLTAPLAFIQGHGASTLYHYRISAFRSSLQSGYLTGTVTTPAASGTLLAAPTSIVATAWSPTTVYVTATGTVGAVYTFLQRSADGGSTWQHVARLISSAKASPITFLDGNVLANTAYKYQMFNVSAAGTGSASSPVSITTPAALLAVSAPTGLSTTVNSPCSVTVFWTPQVGRLEDGFYVERSSNGGSTWRTVAFNLVKGATWFTDIGLAPSVAYTWQVISFNGRTQTGYQTWSFAQSAASSTASASTPAANTDTIPASPNGLSAMAYSDTVVSLEWLLNDQNETGTKIEISTDGGSTWNEILVVSKWLWQTYVTGLVAGTSYEFRGRTFSGGGNSTYTSAVTVTTLAAGHTFTADLGLAASPPASLLTPQQLAIYRQMQADYNANPSSPATFGGRAFGLLFARAAPALTGTGYSILDIGMFAAFMYQITGNTGYAQGAYTIATARSTSFGGWVGYAGFANDLPGNDTNFTRENGLTLAIIYDWCKSGWSATQRQYYARGMRALSNGAISIDTRLFVAGYAFLSSTVAVNVNSSQGPYAMLMGYDVLTSTADDPVAGTMQWQSSSNSGLTPPYPVGGQQPTANDRTNSTNGILRNYGVLAAGGVGIESSEYNLASDPTGALVIEMLRMARGVQGDHAEYYPELRSSSRLAALVQIMNWSPDLGQVWQWGDDQNVRSLGGNGYATQRVTTQSVLAGCARGNATIGSFAVGFLSELWTKNGTMATHGALIAGTNIPYAQYFFLFDPYVSTQPRSALPASLYASGTGSLLHHDGYSNTSSFFMSQFLPSHAVEHPPEHFGDFQLHRQGEWCITHPIWYGSLSFEAEAANSMLHGGFTSGATFGYPPALAIGFRGPVAQQTGTSPTFEYTCGLMWGPVYGTSYFAAPVEFLHEWTRSTVYLPNAATGVDTIVVFDRSFAANPNFLPSYTGTGTTGISRYRAAANSSSGMSDQQRITSNPIQYPATSPTITGTPALKQWIMHCLQQPTVTGSTVTWTTDFGLSNVKLISLAPAGATIQVFSEPVLWSTPCCQITQPMTSAPVAGVAYSPEERYQVRVWPASPWPANATPAWDVFCHVVFAANASGGPTTAATKVTSNGSEVTGPLVSRAGLNDTLLLFSQVASTWSGTATTFARVLASGYTVTWTSTTASTDVLLFDLSPSKSWTSNLDSAGAVSLAVSSAGVGHVSVSGTGSHTLVLVAS